MDRTTAPREFLDDCAGRILNAGMLGNPNAAEFLAQWQRVGLGRTVASEAA